MDKSIDRYNQQITNRWEDPKFSSTWDKFGKLQYTTIVFASRLHLSTVLDHSRRDIRSHEAKFWSSVDERFAQFDNAVRKEHSEMDRQMGALMERRSSSPTGDGKTRVSHLTNCPAKRILLIGFFSRAY